MIIAIDVDGTLSKEFKDWRGVEYIGEPIKENIEYVKQLHREGHTLILYTCRLAGLWKKEDPGVARVVLTEWLKQQGIFECFDFLTGKKPYADIYWDNRAASSPKQVESLLRKDGSGEKNTS